MKIFCIGRNYIDHAIELGNDIPSEPLVFMKPATALLQNNKPFYHPDFSDNIHFECEIILKIGKNGKNISEKFAHKYIKEIGLGIDFTARDWQDKLKAKGHPWEIAKAFNHSAVVGQFIPIDNIADKENISFHLLKNNEKVQLGNTKNMIFKAEKIIHYLSRFFELQQGDLIYTGTPEGVGKIAIGDVLEGYLENTEMFRCEIK
jgi:2-keto-4-pentenoate hydratase/2-oxohepta-3-ene-1,7-dioic acid hydratase in catechol pathway